MAIDPMACTAAHDAMTHDWLEILQSAFDFHEEPPPNAAHAHPDIRVIAANDSGNRVELELRYRTGRKYCCAELACHLPHFDRAWWLGVRSRLLQYTDRDPPSFMVVVHSVIEEGALLNTDENSGLPLPARYQTWTDRIREET